jgi:hypothetical protein
MACSDGAGSPATRVSEPGRQVTLPGARGRCKPSPHRPSFRYNVRAARPGPRPGPRARSDPLTPPSSPPSPRRRWRRLWIAAPLPLLVAAALAGLQPEKPKPPPEPDVDPAEEAFIHTPAGFARPGKPAVADGEQTGSLRLTVVDATTGRPTPARVNVVGADGNYYEPKDNPLAPWSLQRAGDRAGKGPIRYYGWFFYCRGEAVVRVPAGPVRVEVWKGYEFRPEQVSTHVPAGATRAVTVALRRTLALAEHDYYSGDTHIHIERRSEADDEHILDLLAAEDVGTGYILCMNDTNEYSGVMTRQLIPQERGFGPSSVKSRGGTAIASGQEYRAATYGHICLMMHRRLVQADKTVNSNNWPVFGLIGEEARQLGGTSIHAHGGYAREIYADFAQRSTDAVELLQFAEYRGIGLRGWYRMLNAGYRFPALGACDYPYCRALADSRTYVYAPARPDPADWLRLAAQGRSFFTTGPALLLEVDGRRPGDSLFKSGKGPHRISARVRARCEVAPVTRLELLVNSEVVRRLTVPSAAGTGSWLELEETVELTGPAWLAARASSTGPTAKADAEAHTNPVYVYVDGKAPYRQEDLDWLLQQLQGQIDEADKRSFDEKPRVLEYFGRSREELLRIRAAGGQPAPAAPQGSDH